MTVKQLSMFGEPVEVEKPKYEHSYVARKPCGCIVAAISDHPSMKSDMKKAFNRWIDAGFQIERVHDDVVRAEFMGKKCPHGE